MLDAIERRLERLESAPPAVERFDDGPPLTGRIAVLPAAFNPPTLAHLELLRAAYTVPGVESVAAMLTTRNVDKGIFGASLADRIAMLLKVQQERRFLAVLACNQARLTDQSPPVCDLFPDTRVDFIVGYDTLTRIFDDRYYEDMPSDLHAFFTRHRLIAATRGDATVEEVQAYVDTDDLAAPYASFITVIELSRTAADISSSGAREAIRKDRDADGLPPEVLAYIGQRRLY